MSYRFMIYSGCSIFYCPSICDHQAGRPWFSRWMGDAVHSFSNSNPEAAGNNPRRNSIGEDVRTLVEASQTTLATLQGIAEVNRAQAAPGEG